MTVFAREREQVKIRALVESSSSQLVAIYGRRRVGKTFTVSQTLKEYPDARYFELTGSIDEHGRAVPESEFLTSFALAYYIATSTRRRFSTVEDCLFALTDLVDSVKPVFIFLDELPWLAKTCPAFFRGFINLWNNHLSRISTVKVPVAGSATSWMMKNVVQAKTSLAKRVTAKLALQPFTLQQTASFLKSQGHQITMTGLFQIYGAVGGIPFYLSILKPERAPLENLYDILVSKEGLLHARTEYEQLFRYLFESHEAYQKIVDYAVTKKYGVTQKQLALHLESQPKPSGALRRALQNLEYSDLLDKRYALFSKRDAHWFVSDEYVRFVSRWLRSKPVSSYAAFSKLFGSQSYSAWQGFDFEITCFKNHHLILDALSLSGIEVDVYLYHADADNQMDLMLVRADQTITLCELRSYADCYAPTAQDVSKFAKRAEAIRQVVQSKRLPEYYINHCFVTKYGVTRNQYFHQINPLTVTLADVLVL